MAITLTPAGKKLGLLQSVEVRKTLSRGDLQQCKMIKGLPEISHFMGQKLIFKSSISLKPRNSFVGVTSAEAVATSSVTDASHNWVPVIPIEALPKGERRLVRQNGETILLLWFRNEIFAIENTSPAEGAYSEGFLNAKLTQDGCIVCPSTESTYDLTTGEVKDWYPNNPVLRALTPSLRNMVTYPVKVEDFQICVDLKSVVSESAAELVFGGNINVGRTAEDVAVDEVRMVVDENEAGFGFSTKNELINGRAAMAGFLFLIINELITGKGLLEATGFLSFLYKTVLKGFPIL